MATTHPLLGGDVRRQAKANACICSRRLGENAFYHRKHRATASGPMRMLR
jgi:hypothetical protein